MKRSTRAVEIVLQEMSRQGMSMQVLQNRTNIRISVLREMLTQPELLDIDSFDSIRIALGIPIAAFMDNEDP